MEYYRINEILHSVLNAVISFLLSYLDPFTLLVLALVSGRALTLGVLTLEVLHPHLLPQSHGLDRMKPSVPLSPPHARSSSASRGVGDARTRYQLPKYK